MPRSTELVSPSASQPAAETVTPNPHKEDEWLLMCRCESARAVVTLLQSLESITKTRKAVQPVTVFCSPSNLTFHVQGATKQLQASIDMQSTMFSEYRVQADHRDDETEDWQAGGEFSVNLTSILECLQLLGNNPGIQLTFSYNLTHEVLKIELLQDTVLCTAAIPGMDLPADHTNPSLVKAFGDSPIAARIIMMSNTLQHITTELQLVSGATVATVSLTEKEGWVVAVVGHLGECLLSIPAHGSHVINLEINDPQHSCYSYPLSSLLASLKGLDIAQETCITINSIGMMAIQHQILDPSVGGESPSFIDFILCSLRDDDENDDEESRRSLFSRPLSQGSPTQHSQRLVDLHDDEYTERSRASQSRRSTTDRRLSIQSTSQAAARSAAGSQSPSSQGSANAPSPQKEWWDESEDDDGENGKSKHQKRSLFGRPKQRPRQLSPPSRRNRSSPNQLGSEARHSDSDDEDDIEMLDITAAASPQPAIRDEECSSPELLYGKS
jgi:hypothetical protein